MDEYDWEKHLTLCEAVFLGRSETGRGSASSEGGNPDLGSLVLVAAQAIWERLQVFEERGKEVGRWVEAILAKPFPWAPGFSMARFLKRKLAGAKNDPWMVGSALLEVFLGDGEAFKEAQDGAREVQEELYRLLKGLYGEKAEIEELKVEREEEDSAPEAGFDAEMKNDLGQALGGALHRTVQGGDAMFGDLMDTLKALSQAPEGKAPDRTARDGGKQPEAGDTG